MIFSATKAPVFNRGIPPDSFLTTLVNWGKSAPASLFSYNKEPNDIYNSIKPELGPWESMLHRRAAMLETMRVLAGFESSWDWTEGVDITNKSSNTPETTEAGIFQISYNSRNFGADLREMLYAEDIQHGKQFQALTKSDHSFALEYCARLMRHTTKHNGPLYKNRSIFPQKLQGEAHSIYPWLSRDSVLELMELIS